MCGSKGLNKFGSAAVGGPVGAFNIYRNNKSISHELRRSRGAASGIVAGAVSGAAMGAAVGGPVGAGVGAVAGGVVGATTGAMADKTRREQASAEVHQERVAIAAANEAAEAQRASVAATPNRGGSIDMATQLSSKRRRGIQQTFLASRGESGSQTLGE